MSNQQKSEEEEEEAILSLSREANEGDEQGAEANNDVSVLEVDIHSAAAYGEYETITDKLRGLSEAEKQNKINELDVFQSTPLLEACKHGRTKAVETLLSLGASAGIADAYQRTALHYACATGVEEIVRLLVEYGADVNAKDASSETPLHCASRFNFDQVVSLLLRMGADPAVSDSKGNPAIAWTAGFRAT